jgi:hypothetical protein
MTPIKTQFVTIDLDRPSRLQITAVWYNLRYSRPMSLEGRISSSGEGVHIRATYHKPLTDRQSLNIRRALGDDHQRIYYDETRPEAKPSQILFDTKNGKTAGQWTADLEHLQRMYRP